MFIYPSPPAHHKNRNLYNYPYIELMKKNVKFPVFVCITKKRKVGITLLEYSLE